MKLKCPHCTVSFSDHGDVNRYFFGKDAEGEWKVERRTCPECQRFIINLVNGELNQLPVPGTGGYYKDITDGRVFLVWPRGSSRPPCPAEVPAAIAKDYTAACLILNDSPEASAAMSRRCLQNILRDPNAGNVKHDTLYKEIEQVLRSGTVPPYVSKGLHIIRQYGNFGAHPTQSRATGEIVAVEPGEAEWTLDLLETLFGFYYVAQTEYQAKEDILNSKLQAARASNNTSS